MADTRTVRYVTAHYAHLQGLRLVPLGVPFLAAAAWDAGWLRGWPGTTGHGAGYWFVALLAVAMTTSFLTRAWYHRRFGVVYARWRDDGMVRLVLIAAGVVVLVGIQMTIDSPISLPAAFVGIVLAAIAWRQAPRRPHFLLIAIAWLVCAFMRPLGVSPGAMPILWDLVIGLSVVIAGVGDHRILRQALPSLPEAYAAAV